MSKLNTNEQVKQTIEVGLEKLKNLGVDLKEDEFTIVQPFDDGQGIVVSIKDDEERTLSVKVIDSLVVLPVKTGQLDIFGNVESEAE